MSGRKKFATVARSEYDDANLRNKVRADNRLRGELKDIERAHKVKFRDITFEMKRIQSKLPSNDRNFRMSAEYQKVLLQMSRQETMSAQAKTSQLSLDGFIAPDDLEEDDHTDHMRESKSDSCLENTKSENKSSRKHVTRRKGSEEGNLSAEDSLIADKSLAEKRRVWESLSTPKHQNNTRAVRERLESEFIKSRKSFSSPAGMNSQHLATVNTKHDSSGKRSSVRHSLDK